MKRYIFTFLIVCLNAIAMAENIITISSVSGTSQTEVEIVVSLENTDAISALEMTIPLGDHLQYVDESAALSAIRSNGHQISAAQVAEDLRIYIYSMNLSSIKGNSGELLSFSLLLGDEPGDYLLTPNVVMSSAQGTKLEASVESGSVVILAPKLQILNEQIDFGHIPIRSIHTQTLELWNSGSMPLVISDIVVDDSLIIPQQTTLIIEPYSTAYVPLEYAPVNRGAISRSLTVISNDPNGKQQVTIIADPFSVNELHVGSASGIADSIVTIPLTMNNMEPIVAMQCEFVLPRELEYVANTLQVNPLRSNGHMVVSTVKPYIEKAEHDWYEEPQGDTLVLVVFSMSNKPFVDNDGELASFDLRLNGSTGTYSLTPINVILINPLQENMVSATYGGSIDIQSPNFSGEDHINFSDRAITETIKVEYRINNFGSAPLQIERATFLDEGYSIEESLPLTINPWEEKFITVVYQPSEEGDFSTIMNIYTNDPNNRLKAVSLYGHIYEPNALSIDGEIDNDRFTLSVSLNNYTNVVALQYDIHTWEGMTTSQSAFIPTDRMQGHGYVVSNLGNNTYRVIIYSMSNQPLAGNEGLLHQLIFNSQENSFCDNTITLDNIILSNADGKDKVSQPSVSYYIGETKYTEEHITTCDQYTWNDDVYTESGRYTQNLRSVTGCDSIVILNLTINRSEREEYWEIAYDEYYWERNGETYYESGDYEHYTTTDQGCQRIEVLHLTINRSEREEYWETACNEYWWERNGETYYESGDYEHYTTTDQGCTRVEVLHLTINHNEREEYWETACDEYWWERNGETYYESGDYEHYTTTDQGCQRIEVLHLTINHSEREEYWETACDQYHWERNGETYYESGDYEYHTNAIEKLYVGYDSPNDPIIGLIPPRGVSRFTVDGYITDGSGWCFVGTGSPENGNVDDGGDLRIFEYEETLYYDRLWGRQGHFYGDHRNPFNIEFGNYYAKNIETGEYYFIDEENVHEYSNTEYPLTLFYGDYGKIHKVQFFDNNNLLWADINAVIEGGVPMITIDYYNPDGSIYHTQQFTENLQAETRTITEQGCERLEILHLTIHHSEREEYYVTVCDSYEWHGEVYREAGDYTYETTTAHGCTRTEVLHLTLSDSEYEEFNASSCDSYEWHGQVYTESGDYEYRTTTEQGCERLEVLHLIINQSEREEFNATSCDSYEWHGEVYTESGDYEYHTTTAEGCERLEILHLTILPDATIETEELALCPAELPYEWFGQSLSEAGSYTATEQYAAGCDSVVHELRFNVYNQSLPEQVTLPIVRRGEAIDVTVPSAEIYAHIISDSWYAPNALVEWYTLEDAEWIVLTTDPVSADIDQITLKYVVDTDCGSVESAEMVITIESTDVENSQSGNTDTYKVFHNNKLWIIRNGKIYSAQGHLILSR